MTSPPEHAPTAPAPSAGAASPELGAAPDLFLVRTEENWIGGPFQREEVLDLIREGSLGLRDEVCRANGFWFGLHESGEVKLQLGAELQAIRAARVGASESDEVTETKTERLDAGGNPVNEGSEEESTDPGSDLEATPVPDGAGEGSTVVVRVQPKRSGSPRGAAGGSTASTQPRMPVRVRGGPAGSPLPRSEVRGSSRVGGGRSAALSGVPRLIGIAILLSALAFAAAYFWFGRD